MNTSKYQIGMVPSRPLDTETTGKMNRVTLKNFMSLKPGSLVATHDTKRYDKFSVIEIIEVTAHGIRGRRWWQSDWKEGQKRLMNVNAALSTINTSKYYFYPGELTDPETVTTGSNADPETDDVTIFEIRETYKILRDLIPMIEIRQEEILANRDAAIENRARVLRALDRIETRLDAIEKKVGICGDGIDGFLREWGTKK